MTRKASWLIWAGQLCGSLTLPGYDFKKLCDIISMCNYFRGFRFLTEPSRLYGVSCSIEDFLSQQAR